MEYEDGLAELETISACIEDLLDSANIRGYVYLEKDGCESVITDTVIHDDDSEEMFDDIQLNALSSVVLDLLKNRTGYKMIDVIFRTVYNTIFEPDDAEEYDKDSTEQI